MRHYKIHLVIGLTFWVSITQKWLRWNRALKMVSGHLRKVTIGLWPVDTVKCNTVASIRSLWSMLVKPKDDEIPTLRSEAPRAKPKERSKSRGLRQKSYSSTNVHTQVRLIEDADHVARVLFIKRVYTVASELLGFTLVALGLWCCVESASRVWQALLFSFCFTYLLVVATSILATFSKVNPCFKLNTVRS